MAVLSSAEMRWCKVHQVSPLWPTATPQALLLVTESLLLCHCYPAQASPMFRYRTWSTYHTLHLTNGFLHLRHACIQLHSISSVLSEICPPLSPILHQACKGVVNHSMPVVITHPDNYMHAMCFTPCGCPACGNIVWQ